MVIISCSPLSDYQNSDNSQSGWKTSNKPEPQTKDAFRPSTIDLSHSPHASSLLKLFQLDIYAQTYTHALLTSPQTHSCMSTNSPEANIIFKYLRPVTWGSVELEFLQQWFSFQAKIRCESIRVAWVLCHWVRTACGWCQIEPSMQLIHNRVR